MSQTANTDFRSTRPVPGSSSSRLAGSPLPVGNQARSPHSPGTPANGHRPLPGRPIPQESSDTASMQKTMLALRNAFPLLQKLLPMMEGSGNHSSSYLTTQPPAPPVDLEPLENHLVELPAHHRDLRHKVQEQNTAIRRVEDQLDLVREATDRNTMEQQELVEDIRSVGARINRVALVVLLLLAGSLLLNFFLYMHIVRILP